jgi:hypothetical protein
VLKGASHNGHGIKRTLDKLLLRGQGRNPVNYNTVHNLWSLYRFGK